MEDKLRDKLFEGIIECRDLCHACDFWDKQGNFCFGKDTQYCTSLDHILALIKEADWKSPEEVEPALTNVEAIADGFPSGIAGMRSWLEKSHGKFNVSRVFNKLTLRRIEFQPTEMKEALLSDNATTTAAYKCR